MSDYGDDDDEFGEVDDQALAQLVTQFELQQTRAAAAQAVHSTPGGEPGSSGTLRGSFSTRPAENTSYQQYTLFGEPIHDIQSEGHAGTQRSVQRPSEEPTHHTLDLEAIKTWKYPINVELRDYQFNIVSKALLNNILVALPTGLGKTFIAAVVMLNWYRWAPKSQIAFLAPTKPLVQQQIEACISLVGIPRSDTAEISGEIKTALRQEYWSERRVFFCTPHAMLNDISTGRCDPKRFVCVVVDEAHKATGNYASADLIRKLRGFNQSFRLLALSATPGSKVEAIQEVIDNLGIGKIEIRSDESIDIVRYIHKKDVHTQELELPPEVEEVVDLYCKCLEPSLKKLNNAGIYHIAEPRNLTPFGVLDAQRRFAASDEGRRMQHGSSKGYYFSLLKLCSNVSSLAYSLELLTIHGLRLFHKRMLEPPTEEDGVSASEKALRVIRKEPQFREMMDLTSQLISDNNFYGHPKMDYMIGAILKHFSDAQDIEEKRSTRIIVFSEFRDSTAEICKFLKRHEPLVRPSVFVGQAAGKEHKGMSQKDQADVMKKFREGTFNALVCTSIGEEGLDIGEVDLIVLYDCSKSPTRLLQRMGRTGRKRRGEVIVLLTKGKESRNFYQAQDNYKKVQDMIASGKHFTLRDDLSPRILPPNIKPTVEKELITIPEENLRPPELTRRLPKKNLPKPTKNFFMPKGVRTGFTTAGRLGQGSDDGSSDGDLGITRVASKRVLDEPIAELLGEPEDVLMTDEEHERLLRIYVSTGANEDAVLVDMPRLDAFPDAQRRLTATHVISHGRTTKRVVQMLQRIHAIDDDTIRSLERSVDPNLCRSPPKTKPFKPVMPRKDKASRDPVKRTLENRSGNQNTAKRTDRGAPKAVPKRKTAPQRIILSSDDEDDNDDDKETDERQNLMQGNSKRRKPNAVKVTDTLESSDSDLPDALALFQGFQSARSI